MEMKSNDLMEIMRSVDQEKAEASTLRSDLKTMMKGRIRRFLTTGEYEKAQFKLSRDELKGKIAEKRNAIDEKLDYLDEMCTFDFENAMLFIARTLSTIEGDSYAATPFSFDSYDITTQYHNQEEVCLITTEDTTKRLKDSYDNGEFDTSYDMERFVVVDNYLLIDSDDEYCLFDLDTKNIPEELSEKYPYLLEIVIDLINYRISNPDMSEKDAINVMLEQMPSRYEPLIKTKEETRESKKTTD